MMRMPRSSMWSMSSQKSERTRGSPPVMDMRYTPQSASSSMMRMQVSWSSSPYLASGADM